MYESSRIILFLILSAFFSGTETAFFSLSSIQLKKMEKEKYSSSKRIIRLLKNPRQLLITILLGNTIVNIGAASTAAIFIQEWSKKFSFNGPLELYFPYILNILIMTVLLLVIGEITPKLFAYSTAIRFARFSSFFIDIFRFILFPLIIILEKLTLIVSKEEKETADEISKNDLKMIINSKIVDEALDESEKKIIKSIYKLPETKAEEIMVPRVDMVAVNINEGIVALKEIILESGHSKIPIYKNNIDNIVGIVYAKDMILQPHKKTIASIMKKPFFITENIKIDSLLYQFKSQKVHIAIVIDEYGGTSGMVTMEDILEELVGEIQDEYDEELPMISELGKNSYKVSSMISTSDFCEFFNIDIDGDEYENLAALIFDEFNRVPEVGDELIYKDCLKFKVIDIQENRLNYIEVTYLDEKKCSDITSD